MKRIESALPAFLPGFALCAGLLALQTAPPIEGRWEGTLSAGGNRLRLVLEVTKAADGAYGGTLVSVDQGGSRIPVAALEVEGDKVRFSTPSVRGTFEGTFGAGGDTITGTWSQGVPLPLVLKRAAAAATAPAAGKAEQGRSPLGLPLDLWVPAPPRPLKDGDKVHLVYELHLTNLGSREVPLSRLEVLGEEGVVAAYEGSRLEEILARPGTPNLPDRKVLGPGLRAVAFLWVTLDEKRPPLSLRHSIAAGTEKAYGAILTLPPPNTVPRLDAPLSGANWVAANGPSNASRHRRALLAVEGAAQIAQRFAIDWVQVGGDGQTFSGDPKDNRSYLAYGKEALAVADGVVVGRKDGIPENVPGLNSRAVPITLGTIGGNYVMVAVADGIFAFYAHLQPGSLRVNVGDRVKKGQVLGLVGNSGNSTEPHLHFHLSDANSPLGSEGLPYVLRSYTLLGEKEESRRDRLPLEGERVRFGK